MQAVAETTALSGVIRGAQKVSSKISRDRETLGMARIKLLPERLAWYVDGGPAGTAETIM